MALQEGPALIASATIFVFGGCFSETLEFMKKSLSDFTKFITVTQKPEVIAQFGA